MLTRNRIALQVLMIKDQIEEQLKSQLRLEMIPDELLLNREQQ